MAKQCEYCKSEMDGYHYPGCAAIRADAAVRAGDHQADYGKPRMITASDFYALQNKLAELEVKLATLNHDSELQWRAVAWVRTVEWVMASSKQDNAPPIEKVIHMAKALYEFLDKGAVPEQVSATIHKLN